MPFGVVSRIGRWIGVLDGVAIVERDGAVWGKCGASHSNNGAPCVRSGEAALPELLCDFLFSFLQSVKRFVVCLCW